MTKDLVLTFPGYFMKIVQDLMAIPSRVAKHITAKMATHESCSDCNSVFTWDEYETQHCMSCSNK